MSEQHAERRRRAWELVTQHVPDAAGLLVTSLPNVRYLTGFSGSNGILLLTDQTALLGTDGRYVLQASEESPGLPLLVDRATLTAVARHWRDSVGGPLAVETAHITVSQWRALEEALGDSTAVLRETTDLVESLRQVKDAEEVAHLVTACRISEEALARTVAGVREGDTEKQIARRLDATMLELGADRVSFDTIVAVGPNTAIPHHQPTDRPLIRGDFLLIDFGAEYSGYHADETRTFVLGEPAEWQREIHSLVESAQAAGRVAATAGTALADVDAAARQIIEEAGHGPNFDHGLGHGVGLEIHEAPFFSARATGMLLAGSPVTIEPGVYLAGRGGVRIEDTVIVTEGECSPLTTANRGLVVLG